MKVNKKQAVKFLKALGFEKAGEWANDKLAERLLQVPEKVTEKEVPEGHEELYNSLCGTCSTIEFNGEAEVKPKSKATKDVDKELDKRAAAKAATTTPKPKAAAKAVKGAKKAATGEKAPKVPKAKASGEGKSVGLSAYIDTLIAKGDKVGVIFEKAKAKFPGGVAKSWLERTVARKLEKINEQSKKAKAT